uniref:Ribosomal protein S13 n=1 Tax=Ishige okamurae TaxID=233772 RepID=A0A4Y5T7X7_9PHAE|nr:ribosomal protein S13 [Ishige okamurae]QDB64165.1 ribosomal protein S13 [Ishige okamurae]WBP70203.1 ribosomal protein S13 [Ishige okamurae]
MSYIARTSISEKKTLIRAMMKIYGIGFFHSKVILQKSGLGPDSRVTNLSQVKTLELEKDIYSLGLLLNQELKRDYKKRISLLCEIHSYRGFQHRRGLPVRGQRTHSNGSKRPKFKFNPSLNA